MSAAAGPSQQAAAAGAQRQKASLGHVLANLANLVEMAEQGRLSDLQTKQLRQLVITQCKTITQHAVATNNPERLARLPAQLNPSLPWGGDAPIISKETWNDMVQSAIAEAKEKLRSQNMAKAAVAAGSKAPPGLMSPAELKEWVNIPVIERNVRFERDTSARARFQASIAYYTARNQALQNAKAPSTASSTPSTHSLPNKTEQGLPAPGTSASASGTGSGFNLRLPSPTRRGPLVAEAIETESSRRKRKCLEIVEEVMPGMELEVGVDEVLSKVLDSFIQEAAKGSIRLAKHRKSDKVELKDAIFFLKSTYGILEPGFDAHIPERRYIPPETEKKRVRGVVPRAVKLGKGGKDED